MGPVIFILFIVIILLLLLFAVVGLMCRMVSGSKGKNEDTETINIHKENVLCKWTLSCATSLSSLRSNLRRFRFDSLGCYPSTVWCRVWVSRIN